MLTCGTCASTLTPLLARVTAARSAINALWHPPPLDTSDSAEMRTQTLCVSPSAQYVRKMCDAIPRAAASARSVADGPFSICGAASSQHTLILGRSGHGTYVCDTCYFLPLSERDNGKNHSSCSAKWIHFAIVVLHSTLPYLVAIRIRIARLRLILRIALTQRQLLQCLSLLVGLILQFLRCEHRLCG